MKSMTEAEWKEYNARLKELADAKQINYVPLKTWSKHLKECPNCDIETHPNVFCSVSEELYAKRPPSKWFDLPHVTCIHCKKKWEESDYAGVSCEDKMTCPNCGIVYEVNSVDYTISVELKSTGKYDPYYLELED